MLKSTPASEAFHALHDQTKALLARRVFEVLEYDDEGRPGSEWSSDTLQAIGDLFNNFGVVFTDPNDVEDEDDEEEDEPEFDELDSIIRFESGEASPMEVLELFSHLIRTGKVWHLQGSYGRTARGLIESGNLDEEGNISAEAYDLFGEE